MWLFWKYEFWDNLSFRKGFFCVNNLLLMFPESTYQTDSENVWLWACSYNLSSFPSLQFGVMCLIFGKSFAKKVSTVSWMCPISVRSSPRILKQIPNRALENHLPGERHLEAIFSWLFQLRGLAGNRYCRPLRSKIEQMDEKKNRRKRMKYRINELYH